MPSELALWAYCVARAGADLPGGLPGVDGRHPVERLEHDDLSALVSRVPLAEFGEEPLHRNLNDFAWLERVARGHQAILERALAQATIVPLRLCTIFEDEDGAHRMLAEQRPDFGAALEALAGHEEWAVKLLVDPATLDAAARARAGAADLPAEGSGAAYMLRRRHDREVRELADQLAAELAADVHEQLKGRATDAVRGRPQDPKLSGLEGTMLLNGAYLVEAGKAGRLRELAAELQERHRELGARLEVSGPLPPYNFAGRGAAA